MTGEFESYVERSEEAKKSFEALLKKGLEKDAMRDELGLDKSLVQNFSKLQSVREKSDYSPVFLLERTT